MISYKFKKVLVRCGKLWNKLYFREPLSETDVLAKRIIVKFLSKPDTVYLMAPSGKYYLHTGDKKLFVMINDNFIKITNHKYTYENRLSMATSGELISLISRALERSRLKMEKEVFKSEINLLNDILNS